MMHGPNLWYFAKNEEQKEPIQINKRPASNLYYLSDREFFYMETYLVEIQGKEILSSNIYLVETIFGSYKKTKVYSEKDKRAEILNFGVDNQARRLIILSGIKNMKNKRDKFFTIYDFDTEKMVYSLQINNPEIIGRLKSNLYIFTDGHIYFGNKVIKIRYDLLANNKELKENQLFDQYKDILILEKNEYIQIKTPLQTPTYNRLAYMIRNLIDLKPRRLLILPYLHERRVYLNKRENSNQFYTMVSKNNNIYIICLCLEENKMYVYGENSILVKRFTYDKIAEECGKPYCVSEDGMCLLFQKCDISEVVYLVTLDIDTGLKVKKKIDIKEVIDEYIHLLGENAMSVKEKSRYDSIKLYYDKYLGGCKNFKNLQKWFCLNDNLDVLIRIKPKVEFMAKQMKEEKDLAEAFDITDKCDKGHDMKYITAMIYG